MIHQNFKVIVLANLFLMGAVASVVDLCRGEVDQSSSSREDLDNPLRFSHPNKLRPEDVLQLRQDIVKAQILQKLKLDKAPYITEKMDSDEHLKMAFEMLEKNKVDADDEVEDPTSTKTGSFVVFPNNTNFHCHTSNSTICSRLVFSLPPETDSLTSVNLWLYKNTSEGILQVTEPFEDFYQDAEYNERLLAQETFDAGEGPAQGWVRLELPTNVTLQRIDKHVMVTLEISDSAIVEVGLERPLFAAIATRNTSVHRKRRHIECDDKNEEGVCCREKMTINFTEIGYDNWIRQPSSYEAYYCRGTCPHLLSTKPNRWHTAIFAHLQGDNNVANELGFKLCCTASKMAPLHVIWTRDNSTIFHHYLSNMIVKACDCL